MVSQCDVLAVFSFSGKGPDSGQQQLTVLEVSADELVVAHPDEMLRDALGRMLQSKVGRLPIVDRSDRQRVVGYRGRAEILCGESFEAREPGLLARMFPRAAADGSGSG